MTPVAATPSKLLPDRWRDLDPRTIEMIARFNEEEREAIVYFANLTPDQRRVINTIVHWPDHKIKAIDRFASMPDDEREIGYAVVASVKSAGWLLKLGKVGAIILTMISGLILAWNVIQAKLVGGP